MSKKLLKGRTQFKNNVGKLYGRSSGAMVYNEHVGRMVTPKLDKAIKKEFRKKMGKGMTPKKGYNDKKYKDNYDSIDWSKTREKKLENK